MRIFLNHVNTYSGVALARTLRHMGNVLNRLFGTAKGLEDKPRVDTENDQAEKRVPVPSCIRRLISKRNPQQLLQNLLTCSLAIFDLHNTDPDELEFIFKKLRTAQIQQPLTVVLISSLITWGNTRRTYARDSPENAEAGEAAAERREGDSQKEEEESSGEAEQSNSAPVLSGSDSKTVAKALKPRIFSGNNFELRVPPKAYERWKMLETLLMSLNSKENLRGIVVSAGMMYGYGEDALYEPFKAAWLGLQSHKLVGGKEPSLDWRVVRIVELACATWGTAVNDLSDSGAGNNFVPTVHVQDVCNLVKSLAMDASKSLGVYHVAVDAAFATQRQILESIVSELGSPFDIPGMSPEEAALIQTADILSQDLRFECSSLMAAPSFQWHAKEGFISSIKQVTKEFCQCRGLRQLKILVTGPPGSGKTSISERLAAYYNIFHVKTADVVESAQEVDPDLAVGAIGSLAPSEDKKKGKRNPARRVRYDAETMAKLFRATLSQNICRYRGFVLDGFPKSYEECKPLFLRPRKPPSGTEAVEGDLREPELSTQDDLQNEAELQLEPTFAPDFVIFLHASVETCEKRLMSIPPANVIASHNDREGFRKRLQYYMQQNESVTGRPKTTDFFQERGIEVLTLPTDGKLLDDLFTSVIIYISRFGPIRNFLLESTDWLKEQEEALKMRNSADEQCERERVLCERQEEERQLQLQRERDLARLHRIAEYEKQLLLVRSIPLRRYLMQHVIPALSEGMLEVCRVLPEDPVSYLSAFLFAKARQMQ